MIAPHVRMHDLDPDGFAELNRRLASRDRDDATLTVLVENGRVIHAVHPGRDVSRVVILDRSLLDDLSVQLVELARRAPNQGELLWRARELWNAHPAVQQLPPPEASKWPAVAERLARIPDGSWVVANVAGGDRFVLAGRVEGGVLVEITSRVPADAHVAATLDVPLDATPPDLLAWLDAHTTWT